MMHHVMCIMTARIKLKHCRRFWRRVRILAQFMLLQTTDETDCFDDARSKAGSMITWYHHKLSGRNSMLVNNVVALNLWGPRQSHSYHEALLRRSDRVCHITIANEVG